MIEMGKKYRTKSGVSVRILCVDRKCAEYPVVVEMENGVIMTYPLSGRSNQTMFSLVEVKPYEEFRIDEPVMVSDSGITWIPRYFAGVRADGRPCTFNEGQTSWTSNGEVTSWNLARKPTSEELSLRPHYSLNRS